MAASREYVCVRVTDMSAVDLNVLRFDYDLTLAVLLMHPDGTVYHRFGSRDGDDPLRWNTVDGLAALLRATGPEHRAYDAARTEVKRAPPRFVVDLPPLQRKRARDQAPSCVHCHTVHDTLHQDALEKGTLAADAIWVYPPPARIGMRLDPSDQARIAAVEADSPAADVGLRAGDRLLSLGAQSSVRTLGDVQWALHVASPGPTELAATWARGEGEQAAMSGAIALAAGWKRGTSEEYAWRPYKWNLSPAPGFGGALLTRERKRVLSLPEDAFAMRVDYLVTWGERAHRGRAARAAGLREGDVVLAFAGKSDFASQDHFHAWVRLTRQVGESVEIVVWRNGKRMPLRYELPE